jgi:predicted ATPase/DNA-binding winged helix-turn-helix (wHTH) protein
MVSLDLRDLFKDGVALRIGTRAFDILELLIRHQGQLVSKEQILQRVWPDTVVEENNLQVHISALRKALGSDRDLIRTIPGRGYLLLGGESGFVEDVGPEEVRTAQRHQGANGNRLPAGVELVGRAALLGELDAALSDHHALITLIGPGGVGKTSLAVELGRQRLESRLSAVYFVALAEVEHPENLLDAFFRALEIDVCAADPLAFLIQQLAQRSGLLILDNCEHLIDQVAALVEAILRGAPGVRILATSREPLRIGGERSLQVPPLALPEPDANRDAILRSDSAQVFLRHWRALDCQVANTPDAELDDYSIDLVGEVCRRLDGIPLALEMAAARACALGLYQLVGSLDESMHLLSASLRTAPPRQRTLQASLSWSYRLLSRDERTVLRQLADLDGRFTLEQACNALQCATLARTCVMDCMVRLATKSLLIVSAQGPFRFYRMLAATRTCLRLGLGAERASDGLKPDTRGPDSPSSLANLHAARAVPVGPDGYHARHQRALSVGH